MLDISTYLSKDIPSHSIQELSSPDRGVVSGGPEYVKSRGKAVIDSEMAGPISMKLSGIDRGNRVSVLVRVRGGIIQDS